MDGNEFVLTLWLLVLGIAVLILTVLLWNQDRQIEELELLYERLLDKMNAECKEAELDARRLVDHSGGNSGNDISRSDV